MQRRVGCKVNRLEAPRSAQGVPAPQGVLPNIRKSNNVQCLILPDPERTERIQDVERSLRLDYDLASKVREMRRKAEERGITVRWYTSDFSGVSMTFFNPSDSRKGYVNLGLILPHVDADDRPLVRISRKQNEHVFDRLWQSSGAMKNDSNSRAPDP